MSSNRDGPPPKPGDLIEISYLLQKHWAVYMGDDYVVHLVRRKLVQKELLTKVTLRFKYRVNNKHDEKKLPLPAKEIVQRAEALVGKVILSPFPNYNSEHFATKIRYEVPLSDQNRKGPWPKSGDLIEIFREGYEHWAVYVGDGYVIHLTDTDHGVSGIDLVGPGSGLSVNAMEKKEPLIKVTAGCKYQVNNKYDKKMKPLPAKKIVSEAEQLVGKVMNYNLKTKNCEHFVTTLHYEEPRSDQEDPEDPNDFLSTSYNSSNQRVPRVPPESPQPTYSAPVPTCSMSGKRSLLELS